MTHHPFHGVTRSEPGTPRASRSVLAISRRHATLTGCYLVALALALALPAPVARAQSLLYDHTTFLNGFGSGPGIWTRNYSDIGTTPPDYLGRSIVLETIGFANLDSTKTYNQQVDVLDSYLQAGGHHVLVAHSLGSLVARGTYINKPADRPEIAGIIAVAAPHQGTLIADNFDRLVAFFTDVQRRLDGARGGIFLTGEIFTFLFGIWNNVAGVALMIISTLIDVHMIQTLDISTIAGLGSVPALQDLKVGSPAIADLNSHFDDGAIPRANIYGNISTHYAAFRVFKSAQNDDAGFDHFITMYHWAITFYTACKYVNYATIVFSSAGRKCGFAVKVLKRIDDRWAMYVNGTDAYGRARLIPFDGIVPNERSRYPSQSGTIYDAVVPGVTHVNIYKTRAGLNKVVNAMGFIGMRHLAPPPPPPDVTALISGPNVVNTDWHSTWSSEVSGGTPPYTYTWSGLFNGHGSSISGTTQTDGELILDVYDAVGGHGTVTKFISSTGCAGQNLC